MDLSMFFSIISIMFVCLNFFFNRKDKSVNDAGSEQYKMGRIEERLNVISEQLDKLSTKLDAYDNEIEKRIARSREEHEKIYHHKGV